MQEFEKLGSFYLGKEADKDDIVLYDSKDLTTHAVCVGMTGSGKTGLCIGVLEEAAIDRIPAIAIDPKGDISNLLLTFPELRPEDFRPWINEDEARLQNQSADEFAAAQASLWKNGIAQFGQDGERIKELKNAVDFSIYTPGSETGLPLSILKAFNAPAQAVIDDNELFRDRVDATASSLLGLAGIDADLMQSREHVLLANIFDVNWRAGKAIDLAGLIGQIQKPPFTKAGVMDLETFYPAKERFELAMSFNNMLASPSFNSWLNGEPLDIAKLLYTAEGKPRISILSIAHLSDPERMFFVSLFLNEMLMWVRTQPGTGSLRALVYMDEIFGYFPPVANPPSKKPLLTLVKQARAYGVGLMLATQNPADLDYKGLANAGTWLIGRLQTERDKARVLDGLESAAGEANGQFDRASIDHLLSGLGKRKFLLNSAHHDHPTLFETRWTLSYLRGPISREQIRLLSDGKRPATEPAPATNTSPVSSAPPSAPPDINVYYIPVTHTGEVVYQPVIAGAAKIHYLDDKRKIDEVRDLLCTVAIEDGPVAINWENATAEEISYDELEKTPEESAQFGDLPSAATKAKNYAAWSKSFASWLFQSQQLTLFQSPSLGEVSKPGESERDFRVRLQLAAREERDRIAETLKQKYAPKLAALTERKRKAEIAAATQKSQQSQAMLQTALSVGSGLLNAFLGHKAMSVTNISRVATAARQAGRSWQEREQVEQATDNVEQIAQQWNDLQAQFNSDVESQQGVVDPATEKLETFNVRAKKTNISVQFVALTWKA